MVRGYSGMRNIRRGRKRKVRDKIFKGCKYIGNVNVFVK